MALVPVPWQVAVSCTAGKTKHLQTLLVGTDLILCDCPGLVMPQVGTVSTLASARTTLRHPVRFMALLSTQTATAQLLSRGCVATVALCASAVLCSHGQYVRQQYWSRSDRMPCQHAGWDTLLVLGCTCTGRLVEG